jgi:DHA2 family metal-tetracycline-proton antiporter-like MFS transporter
MSKTIDVRRTVPWIIFSIFFAVLNETVFNVSTPVIAAQFNLTAAEVSWVMTTFIIFFGVGSVIYGKLSDIFSLRTLIVFGILLYVAGSILGFVLQFYYPAVIAGRGIQGAGASAIPALVNVLVARYFPVAERGRIFGTITSTVAFAIGVGPVIGGFVSGTLHWSLLFVIPVFTIIAARSFLKLLPAEERRPGTVDIPGAVMIALSVGTLMVFLTMGLWYFLVASIVLLVGFVLDVLFSKNPFIDLALLKNGAFRKRLYAGFIIFSVVTGVLFVIPFMLHSVSGLGSSQIGFVLFPGAMSAALVGRFGGNLADRRGNGFVIAIGLTLLCGSFLALSSVLGRSVLLIGAALVLMYVGFNFTQTALINSVSQSLDETDIGVGMGLFNLSSFISNAIGTALVGNYLQSGGLRIMLNPLVVDAKVIPYSNLLVIFSLLVALGGVLYFRSSRARGATPVPASAYAEPERTSAEDCLAAMRSGRLLAGCE